MFLNSQAKVFAEGQLVEVPNTGNGGLAGDDGLGGLYSKRTGQFGQLYAFNFEWWKR